MGHMQCKDTRTKTSNKDEHMQMAHMQCKDTGTTTPSHSMKSQCVKRGCTKRLTRPKDGSHRSADTANVRCKPLYRNEKKRKRIVCKERICKERICEDQICEERLRH